MFANATIQHWNVLATNQEGIPVEQTKFVMTVESEDYAVTIDHAVNEEWLVVTVKNVKDADPDQGGPVVGFFQDEEFLGTMQEVTDAVAGAYDDCIDNRA